MLEVVKGEKVELFLTTEQIAKRVKELATEIISVYGEQPITLLGTLKGAIFFLSDLARELGPNVELDFVKASSYGDSTKSTGQVKLEYHPSSDLLGRHVLIVEDIVDTGHTATFLRQCLMAQGPASIRLCSLLDKPSRREVKDLQCDFLGFSIPDEFVVGYGLDFAQRYRTLPYVGIMRFDKN